MAEVVVVEVEDEEDDCRAPVFDFSPALTVDVTRAVAVLLHELLLGVYRVSLTLIVALLVKLQLHRVLFPAADEAKHDSVAAVADLLDFGVLPDVLL